MATLRFPTGSTESLRGMGVTRTMVSFIASGGQARFRPHANVGYEFWSNSVKRRVGCHRRWQHRDGA